MERYSRQHLNSEGFTIVEFGMTLVIIFAFALLAFTVFRPDKDTSFFDPNSAKTGSVKFKSAEPDKAKFGELSAGQSGTYSLQEGRIDIFAGNYTAGDSAKISSIAKTEQATTIKVDLIQCDKDQSPSPVFAAATFGKKETFTEPINVSVNPAPC